MVLITVFLMASYKCVNFEIRIIFSTGIRTYKSKCVSLFQVMSSELVLFLAHPQVNERALNDFIGCLLIVHYVLDTVEGM